MKIRKILGVLAIMIFLAGIVYAGGSQEPSGPITVTWGTGTYPEYQAWFEKTINEFLVEYPGIKHKTINYGVDLPTGLNIAYQNDEAPDWHEGWMINRSWIDMGRLATLDDLLSKEHQELYAPHYVDRIHVWDGKLYGQPKTGWTFRFIINRDLFRGAGLDPSRGPVTYTELKDYAHKITEYGKSLSPRAYGFCLPVKETWIWEIYCDQYMYTDGVNKFNWKTLEYEHVKQKPIMQTWLDMQDEDVLFPGPTTLENDPARAHFADGVIGMMSGAAWNVAVWNHQFPTDIEWTAVRFPTSDGKIRGKNWCPLRADFVVNANSKHKKEAAMIIEHITSLETMARSFEAGFGLPVHPRAFDYVNYPLKDYGWEGFLDKSNDSAYPPEFSGLPLEGDDRGTVYTAIIARQRDLDEALVDLDERYNAAFAKLIEKGMVDPEKHRIPDYDPMNPVGR